MGSSLFAGVPVFDLDRDRDDDFPKDPVSGAFFFSFAAPSELALLARRYNIFGSSSLRTEGRP